MGTVIWTGSPDFCGVEMPDGDDDADAVADVDADAGVDGKGAAAEGPTAGVDAPTAECVKTASRSPPRPRPRGRPLGRPRVGERGVDGVVAPAATVVDGAD